MQQAVYRDFPVSEQWKEEWIQTLIKISALTRPFWMYFDISTSEQGEHLNQFWEINSLNLSLQSKCCLAAGYCCNAF